MPQVQGIIERIHHVLLIILHKREKQMGFYRLVLSLKEVTLGYLPIIVLHNDSITRVHKPVTSIHLGFSLIIVRRFSFHCIYLEYINPNLLVLNQLANAENFESPQHNRSGRHKTKKDIDGNKSTT